MTCGNCREEIGNGCFISLHMTHELDCSGRDETPDLFYCNGICLGLAFLKIALRDHRVDPAWKPVMKQFINYVDSVCS